jgi:hypothetical protein
MAVGLCAVQFGVVPISIVRLVEVAFGANIAISNRDYT